MVALCSEWLTRKLMTILVHEETVPRVPLESSFLHSYKESWEGNFPLVIIYTAVWWGGAWNCGSPQRTKLWTQASVLERGPGKKGKSSTPDDLIKSGNHLSLDFLLWERIRVSIFNQLTWIFVACSWIYTNYTRKFHKHSQEI